MLLFGFTIVFLTEKGLEQMTAQDGRHFAHAVLQALLLWTGHGGLVLPQQAHRPICVCLTKQHASKQQADEEPLEVYRALKGTFIERIILTITPHQNTLYKYYFTRQLRCSFTLIKQIKCMCTVG